MIQKLSDRFDELLDEVNEIESQKQKRHSEYQGTYYTIDIERFLIWKVKAKNLIRKSCGEDSVHYQEFVKLEKPRASENNFNTLWRARGVFIAAKDDYQDGLLLSTKILVQAEVFDSQLEQAKELLDSGYYLPAAVVAGVVLETGLRDLCNREGIDVGKLDKMNADLAKDGVYNKLQQKRITAIADIRNSAAHGRLEEFTSDDVSAMIRDVEQFLINILVT